MRDSHESGVIIQLAGKRDALIDSRSAECKSGASGGVLLANATVTQPIVLAFVLERHTTLENVRGRKIMGGPSV
jgi:hypothetical protein